MGRKKVTKQIRYKDNWEFIDPAVLNTATYNDYLARLRRIALSRFEWVNLPSSMDSFELEKSLFFHGMASFLKDENYGFINTNTSNNGYINIYGLPTSLNCWAFSFQTSRKLYTGLKAENDEQQKDFEKNFAILVLNNIEREPTAGTIELFAYRLFQAESVAFTNINAQKTPVLIVCDEKQRLTLENLYAQYSGNYHMIFGDSSQLNVDQKPIQAIKTDAPFIADKIMDYKKEIWNEALTFLGVNNIMVDKKERLVSDEANSNNELINLNLESYLATRQKACEQFNELFNLKDTDKAISVRVRSDLHNIIKNEMSIISDFKKIEGSEVNKNE